MLAALARTARQGEVWPFICRAVSALPAKRSVEAAKRAPAATTATKPPLLKEILLYRFNPENDAKPYYQTYRVDINKCVQYRWACGVFGPRLRTYGVSVACTVQLWPYDAGRFVQDQGRARLDLVLQAVLQVSPRSDWLHLSWTCACTRSVVAQKVSPDSLRGLQYLGVIVVG
jgi:hypothetical protein